MMTQEVWFHILLNNNPVMVSAGLNDTLTRLFVNLHNNIEATGFLPKVSSHACTFYRLNSPVALGNDPIGHRSEKVILDEVKEACLDNSRRVQVNPTRTKVRDLASELSDDHICLVIEIPDPLPDSERAILNLESDEGKTWGSDVYGITVFEAEDIQQILREMNYKIEFIPWGHSDLAVIVSKTGDKHGYLKFVDRDREVNVLQYLTGIESPSNHTISYVRFWPVEGGTVISMPVAGGWLTSLDNLDKQLWSVTRQLVEGVAFMHENLVAHMDLKPQNVVIPAERGRLSIIDFSVSIHVRTPDARYNGVVGTEYYIAPEVRKGRYKPMLADLWSCGKTLEELCLRCRPSADQRKVLEIAKRLMDRDPKARPRMTTVLEWINSAPVEKDVMWPRP